jgi:hypothetical protein
MGEGGDLTYMVQCTLPPLVPADKGMQRKKWGLLIPYIQGVMFPSSVIDKSGLRDGTT